jgi:hypothetical protein
MTHQCHARRCGVGVKPELLMCARHWRMVPPLIQRAIWRHYRSGQCDDKMPSEDWHVAADAAIGYVALLDGQPILKNEARALCGVGYRKFILETMIKRHGEKARTPTEAMLDQVQVSK